MIVNRDNLGAVFINLRTDFNKAFEGAPSIWQQTAMEVPSTGLENLYVWLSNFPKMRKWIGDKVIKALAAHGYTIVNDEWEATVSVLRKHIETDSVGIYKPQAMDAGYSAKAWPDEMLADLINAAFTGVCYDGQYFYDTDHPVGPKDSPTSVSNMGTAVLSCATKALALASYGAGRAAIMGFTDDESRPLGLISDCLEVPPALEATGNTLCNSDKLDDNSPNPFKGTAKLLVNPRLTSSTAWFLHVTSRPIRPFIVQIRKRPQFVQQTDMQSEGVFKRGEYLFGAEASGNAGYGLWQLSYGSTGLGS